MSSSLDYTGDRIVFDSEYDNDGDTAPRVPVAYEALADVLEAQKNSKRLTEEVERSRRQLAEVERQEAAAYGKELDLTFVLHDAMKKANVEALLQNGYVYCVAGDQLIERRWR